MSVRVLLTTSSLGLAANDFFRFKFRFKLGAAGRVAPPGGSGCDDAPPAEGCRERMCSKHWPFDDAA